MCRWVVNAFCMLRVQWNVIPNPQNELAVHNTFYRSLQYIKCQLVLLTDNLFTIKVANQFLTRYTNVQHWLLITMIMDEFWSLNLLCSQVVQFSKHNNNIRTVQIFWFRTYVKNIRIRGIPSQIIFVNIYFPRWKYEKMLQIKRKHENVRNKFFVSYKFCKTYKGKLHFYKCKPISLFIE